MLRVAGLRRLCVPAAVSAAGISSLCLYNNDNRTLASAQPGASTSAALDSLWQTVEARRGADPKSSWTAKLLSKGVEKCSQKVGEEATEVVIEAVKGDKVGLIKESADLLYHLFVLWAAAGVTPADVYSELRRREGVSGIAEKLAR